MLTSYHVRNYKAFKEAKIDLRAFTLLLGPNNSGKTCLIEVLLLMQQTLEASQAGYKAPVKLNGPIVSLGSIEHLFHKGNKDEPITLGFEFTSQSLATKIAGRFADYIRFIYSLYRDYYRFYAHLAEKSDNDTGKNMPEPGQFWLDFRSFSELRDEDSVGKMLTQLAKLREFSTETETDDLFADIILSRKRPTGRGDGSRYKLPDLQLTADFLMTLSKAIIAIPHLPEIGISRPISCLNSVEMPDPQL